MSLLVECWFKMRKTYKFSHSIVQGDYLYVHKTLEGKAIENKEGLRNVLTAVARKFELMDVTIKVYGSLFFFFFMSKPRVAPLDVINAIQKHLHSFSSWSQEYVYTDVYDLQEEYVKKDLEKLGFNYDAG